jgi:8-oxo-dGTP diphosphatase
VVAAIARSGGRYLLARRKKDLSRGGEWEFPGGKVLEGESLDGALRREIREELKVECDVFQPFSVGHFPGGKMIAFWVSFRKNPFESTDHDEFHWFKSEEILNLPLSFADYEIAIDLFRKSQEVRKLNVLSVLRFFMLFYFLFGLALGLGAYFFHELFPFPMWGGFQTDWKIFTLVPILYLGVGLVLGLLISFSYNFVSFIGGGIEVETQSK